METLSKILLLALFPLSTGEPAKDEIKKMMLELNDRISIAEEKLLKTEEYLAAALAATNDNLSTTNDNLSTTNDNLSTTNDNLSTTNDNPVSYTHLTLPTILLV